MAEMKLKKKKLSVNLSYHNLTDSIKQNGANKSPKVFEGSNGVVGLGILAALKCDRGRDRYEDPTPVLAISPKYSSKPTPIIDFSRNGSNRKRGGGGGGGDEVDFREEYTCVISHVGDNLVRKREFFEADFVGGNGNDGTEMFFGLAGNGGGGNATSEIAGFLDSCYLCKKTLDGLDIFMYSGEKAFCSDECRYRQISIDEQNEKCHSSGARNPLEHSASPCSATSRFFAGVAAA